MEGEKVGVLEKIERNDTKYEILSLWSCISNAITTRISRILPPLTNPRVSRVHVSGPVRAGNSLGLPTRPPETQWNTDKNYHAEY